MSSTTQHASRPKGPAPWKAAFLDHVSKDHMESPEFVLSTVHPAPAGSSVPYVPRARYCIFRGMWAELPENKHNDAPRNARVFGSDLPTFTTDVRMDKVPELFSTSSGHASDESQVQGSGGGGPVEAVWWVKDTKTQWRMRGEAFVVGPDIEGEADAESSGVRTVKSEVGKRMYLESGAEDKEGEWSWSTELTGQFGNISPAMRGSFKQPPPGKPVSEPFNDQENKMGEKVETLDDSVARKNFRVVIIRPQEVEQLLLTDPDNSKRTKYSWNSATLSWDTLETWP